jgi:hypothetical protein
MAEYKNVAICFSGHLRTHDIFQTVYKSIITNLVNTNPNYRFFIFIHSWNKLDHNIPSATHTVDINSELLKIIGHPIKFSITSPVKLESKFIYDNFSRYPNVKEIENRKLYNCFSQYTSIYRANQLKKEFEKETNIKFDVSIRTRSDLQIASPIYLDKLNMNTFNMTDDDFGFPDWFCIASSELMDYYSDLINHFDELIKQISNNEFCNNIKVDQHNLLIMHLLNKGYGENTKEILKYCRDAIKPDINKDYESKIRIPINRFDFDYWFLGIVPANEKRTFRNSKQHV